jgi:aspartate/methionine/tyrosine aminotransferase
MKSFAKAFERIGTESAFAVGPEISSWVEKGYDIVRVNVGEPGCNIARKATEAAMQSFKNHQTHYVDSKGDKILRQETADYVNATRGTKFTAEDVIYGPGGKPIIAGTMFLLVNPGDEVIYPSPGYPIYESFIDYLGAKRVPIALKEEKNFRFDIADLRLLVSKKTKLLILNSPSNPTGGVLSKDDYQEIAILAKKYDFYILTDEIYSRISFGNDLRDVNFKGNKFKVTPSILNLPGMAERTVLMDGFSKTYAMTGLRLGYSATKIPGFSAKMLTFAINFYTCLPQPCMEAALAALGKDQSEAQNEVELYRQKRDLVVNGLNKIRGISCHSPIGSFYLFPNVTKVCKHLRLKDAESLRKYLLSYDRKNKKGVAVLSRIHFGKKLPGERAEYIRISVAGSLESLKEAIKRIKQAVE